MNCFRFQWEPSFAPILNWSFNEETRSLQNFVLQVLVQSLHTQGYVIKSVGIEIGTANVWVCCIGNPEVGNMNQIQNYFQQMNLQFPISWIKDILIPTTNVVYPLVSYPLVKSEQTEMLETTTIILILEPQEENAERSLLSSPSNASKLIEEMKNSIQKSKFMIIDVDIQYSYQPTFISFLIKGKQGDKDSLPRNLLLGLKQSVVIQNWILRFTEKNNQRLLNTIWSSNGDTQTNTFEDDTSCLLTPKLESWYNLRKVFRLFCYERVHHKFEKMTYRSMTDIIFNVSDPQVEAVGLLPVLMTESKVYGLLQKRNPNMIPSANNEDNDYWNVIAGHVEQTDKSIIYTIFRETREELGSFNPFGCSVDHAYILSFKQHQTGKRFVLFVLVLDPVKAVPEWNTLSETMPNDVEIIDIESTN